MHPALVGQSCGPPNFRSEFRSEIFVRCFDDAVADVTTNAFVSTALVGFNATSPTFFRYVWNSGSVFEISADANPAFLSKYSNPLAA